MAVTIRLKRTGRRGKPFYRVVVADERNPRQSIFADNLGYYDPMQDPAQIQINEEKALMWLKKGAKTTETARGLLSKAGILQKFHDQRQAHKEDETQSVSEKVGL